MPQSFQSVLVRVEGEQWAPGEERQTIRFACPGRLYVNDGGRVLLYRELEAAGMGRTLTKLELRADGGVRLVRTGDVSMSMTLYSGQKEETRIHTPHGILSLGLFVSRVQLFEQPDGGCAKLSYTLDYGNQQSVNTRLDIRYQYSDEDGWES